MDTQRGCWRVLIDLPKQETVDGVADATVECLLRAVPAAVQGLRFCRAANPVSWPPARLNAMNVRFKSRLPWALTFSLGHRLTLLGAN